MNKIAYPNIQMSTISQTPYDLTKWISTFNKIYSTASQNNDWNLSLKAHIDNWDPVEKLDFLQWIKFYNNGGHQAYKVAQLNSSFPINELKAKLPPTLLPEESNKKLESENKMKAIISRLNSAERLATSDPVLQKELDKKLDNGFRVWLEELQKVKRMIQILPTKNADLMEDLIVRHGLKLIRAGYSAVGRELIKVAQQAPAVTPPSPPGPIPGVTPQPTDPNAAQPQPDGTGEEAIEEFIKGLNFDVADIQDMDEDPVSDLTVVAQEVPLPQPDPAAVPVVDQTVEPAPVEEDLVVEQPEAEVPPESEFADTQVHQKTDLLLEHALSQVTVNDVINRIENLVNLFRTREIPRQLAIIDIMMDQLNLSAFFPSLAEASSKTLDANQYALTRIEDILAKLKGTIKVPKEDEIDLFGNENRSSGESTVPIDPNALAESLKADEVAEKQRKDQRKQQENNKLDQAVAPPQITDLNPPAEVPPQALPQQPKV
jgi:hypothetical protein